MTEAAEEIRAAADPEANIIFGTSFNERLGDEVKITVIATGFDGAPWTSLARRPAASSSERDGRTPRDFLEELERQRTSSTTRACPMPRPPGPTRPRARTGVRSVGEPVPVKRAAYDADDLEIPSFLRRQK